MTTKKIQKKVADIRRTVGREYGFRQSAYINFRVEAGYFFCLYSFNDEFRLTVKPMYADTLWWEIWDAEENIKSPLSLRGKGAYALSGQVIGRFAIQIDYKNFDAGEVERQISEIFREASAEIAGFLKGFPDANTFSPDESRMDHDPDRLLYLMTLIHNGKGQEVLAIIDDARARKHKCMFRSGMFGDSYTYIRRWLRRDRRSVKILNTTRNISKKLCRLVSDGSNEYYRKANEEKKNLTRRPWYRRLPEWAYWVLSMPIWVPISFYLIELNKRTLYHIPEWLWLVCPITFIVLFIFR